MPARFAEVRRRGRELAVQMLSSWDANPIPPPATIAGIRELTRASDANLAFAEQLANAAWDRMEEIDERLNRAMKPYWRDHMGRVERSVLRVAVGELLGGETPAAVVVSEAIEVVRRYAGDAAAPFIHGVLDTVVREMADAGSAEKTENGEAAS